jgi:hypothetical protein
MMEYIKEYYVGHTFKGYEIVKLEKEPSIGFVNNQKHTADDTFKIGKKKIVKGENYMTIFYPFCEGKKQWGNSGRSGESKTV